MRLAMWQPTCAVALQTKDAVYTLSAMTSGIRRNWIEALRKTVRPTSAPDVTKYVLSWTGALGEALSVASLSGFLGTHLRTAHSGPSFLCQQHGKRAVSILSIIQKYAEGLRFDLPPQM